RNVDNVGGIKKPPCLGGRRLFEGCGKGFLTCGVES
ncbi:MAG: hypothetical protein ACI9AF_001349, partial [Granulosicoccus sp.]